MELTLANLTIVGLVGSFLTAALRLLADKYEYVPSRELLVSVLFAISTGLSVAFFGLPVVEAGAGPTELAQAIVMAAAGVFGSATVIYNLLAKRVFRQPETE